MLYTVCIVLHADDCILCEVDMCVFLIFIIIIIINKVIGNFSCFVLCYFDYYNYDYDYH
jgi:hypothetical protein